MSKIPYINFKIKKFEGIMMDREILKKNISNDVKIMLIEITNLSITDIINKVCNKDDIIFFQNMMINHEFSKIDQNTITNNENLNNYKKVILLKKYNEAIEKLYEASIEEAKLLIDNFVIDYYNFVNDEIYKTKEMLIEELDDNIRDYVKKKYEIIKYSRTEDEYQKKMVWINCVLDLPKTVKKIEINDNYKTILKIRNYVDKYIYGMEEIKIKVISFLLSYIKNPNSKNNNIALLGSPGIGKTKLLKCIADSIGLPFSQISVGSCKDSGYLTGSSSFYSKSKEGIIAASIIKMGYKNGVILFDEIDKTAGTSRGDGVLNTLLHVCDPTQNNAFSDDYLEGIPIDLSGYLLVFTMNNMEQLSAPLKSRLNIIPVKNYTLEEKLNIVKNFTIPELLKDISGKMIFSDEIIKYIIKYYCDNTNDIREINNAFSNVVKVIDYYTFVDNVNYKYPLTIDHEKIRKVLGEKNEEKKFNYYI